MTLNAYAVCHCVFNECYDCKCFALDINSRLKWRTIMLSVVMQNVVMLLVVAPL
jgi:hypothetical protein